jgi:hypothetical protein
MPLNPIKAIKEIIRFGGILGPAMIAAAIILLIIAVVWAALHDYVF